MTNLERTYYDILEVEMDADQKEIRKSYRRLSKKYHPDVSKEDTQEKFEEITKAYDVLSDEDLRKEYDRALRYEESKKYTFQDLWSQIKDEKPAINGENIKIQINTTIERLAKGGEVEFSYERLEPCDCEITKDDRCETCLGTGQETYSQKTIIGNVTSTRLCTKCKGYGVPLSKHAEGCDGEFVKKKVKQKIDLTDRDFGEVIMVVGKGNKGVNGGMHGSLYVTINHKYNERDFGRGYRLINNERNDVEKVIPIKMQQFLEEKIKVEMPNGEFVETTPELNQTKVFNGYSFGKKGEKGDVYIKFTLDVGKLSSEKKRKLAKFWREEIED